MRFSFAVMSGGEGRRFGSDKTKALLLGKPLYMYALEAGILLSDDVMLVSRDPLKYEPFIKGIKYLADEYPNQCPMAGMMTAAKHAVYDRVFVLSADAPLFSSRLVSYIAEKGTGRDAAIPVLNEKNYNLAAIYSVSMLKSFESFYNKGAYRLTGCYEGHDVLFLKEPDLPDYAATEHSFLNINTLKDLELAERILSHKNS